MQLVLVHRLISFFSFFVLFGAVLGFWVLPFPVIFIVIEPGPPSCFITGADMGLAAITNGCFTLAHLLQC